MSGIISGKISDIISGKFSDIISDIIHRVSGKIGYNLSGVLPWYIVVLYYNPPVSRPRAVVLRFSPEGGTCI